MDFFDFLFGKKKDKSSKEQASLSSEKENSNQHFPLAQQASTHSIAPVEQYVKESIADLKKHTSLSTKGLEAEAIYLAAFLYMKDSYQIDFELDYFSDGLLDQIPSGDYTISDQVFSYMKKYGEGYYGSEEADYGISGYKTNIQMTSDYGSYIKNYFMRAHNIGAGDNFVIFNSPRNCLWKDGVKIIDSPTQRDVYYKFNKGNFEFMIPPYNPLVTGYVKKIDEYTLRCESNDRKRTFVFHFDGEIKHNSLLYIEMYRNDKGDMVSYHKDKVDDSVSLDNIANGEDFEYKFHIMLCNLKKKGERFGTLFIIEQPLKNNLTANLSYSDGTLQLELPMIESIRGRGGINIDSHLEISGTFEKVDYDTNVTCYQLTSSGIEVKVLCKRSSIYSLIEIPVSTSSNPDYRNYDTLSIQLW